MHLKLHVQAGVMSLVGVLIVARFVPETKGRSLESVAAIWGR